MANNTVDPDPADSCLQIHIIFVCLLYFTAVTFEPVCLWNQRGNWNLRLHLAMTTPRGSRENRFLLFTHLYTIAHCFIHVLNAADDDEFSELRPILSVSSSHPRRLKMSLSYCLVASSSQVQNALCIISQRRVFVPAAAAMYMMMSS